MNVYEEEADRLVNLLTPKFHPNIHLGMLEEIAECPYIKRQGIDMATVAITKHIYTFNVMYGTLDFPGVKQSHLYDRVVECLDKILLAEQNFFSVLKQLSKLRPLGLTF